MTQISWGNIVYASDINEFEEESNAILALESHQRLMKASL